MTAGLAETRAVRSRLFQPLFMIKLAKVLTEEG